MEAEPSVVEVDSPETFLERLPDNHAVVFRGARGVLGLDPEERNTTEEAIKIARFLGYDCAIGDVAGLLDSEAITPDRHGSEYAWRPLDLAKLVISLHSARKWLPGHWDALKTPAELRADERKMRKTFTAVMEYADLPPTELAALREKNPPTSPFGKMLALAAAWVFYCDCFRDGISSLSADG
jgi:hypothetical protein